MAPRGAPFFCARTHAPLFDYCNAALQKARLLSANIRPIFRVSAAQGVPRTTEEKEADMALFTDIKTAARKRAEYRRTLNELRSMPLETMIDLDMAPNEFERIAHRAVYGK